MLNAYSQNSKTTITLGRSGTYGKLNGETLEKNSYVWLDALFVPRTQCKYFIESKDVNMRS